MMASSSLFAGIFAFGEKYVEVLEMAMFFVAALVLYHSKKFMRKAFLL